jgi:hypothetical protein
MARMARANPPIKYGTRISDTVNAVQKVQSIKFTAGIVQEQRLNFSGESLVKDQKSSLIRATVTAVTAPLLDSEMT